MNDRFYDKTVYAPKDRVNMDAVEEVEDTPFNYNPAYNPPVFSTYAMSGAALYNPNVMARETTVDPFTLGGGFRCPSYSDAKFPDLKSHMMEHSWLQNNNASQACNPSFALPSAGPCQPWYFNASIQSSPATLFYDGHVAQLGCREAAQGDAATRISGGQFGGLYFRATGPEAESGLITPALGGFLSSSGYYLSPGGYETQATNFFSLGHHVMTKDGILGRDTLGAN